MNILIFILSMLCVICTIGLGVVWAGWFQPDHNVWYSVVCWILFGFTIDFYIYAKGVALP